ncbi:PEP-CTERM sorting domain-containing protein [Piscinibacter koreensis]|uniref:PEP-CTERM sorting domain-containing protein n=1 Tax=Piscinibacter koreensis TaxID=2742824 RepID=UPI001C378E21|nr:PEP-CTERM sorting domain-containing protein [Schlegelella koreensis]
MTASCSLRARGTALAAAAALAVLGSFTGAAVAAPVTPNPGTILFIGNSFTFGQGSAVQTYRPNTVTDLNGGTTIGGIPALFKAFTSQAGLNYNVYLETQPGIGLDWHYNNRRTVIDRPWDNVVMHTFSTLNASAPGNPAQLIQYTGLLVDLFEARNPNVQINLMATWSRADQTYPANGAWFGQDIFAMSRDVRAGYMAAAAANPEIDSVIQVGSAWDLAIRAMFADSNPYNGIDPGKVNLWASDSYHASMFGSYLEALTIFGTLTGIDPRTLGYEQVARDLGITEAQARTMQYLAWANVFAVPEPGTAALLFMALGVAGVAARRRKAAETA